MDSDFVFFVVHERGLPQLASAADSAGVIAILLRALDAVGIERGRVRMTTPAFGGAFEAMDRVLLDGRGSLPEMAFANSPHQVLDRGKRDWRFGYFTPETCHLLGAVVEDHDPELRAALAPLGPAAMRTYQIFAACLDEAGRSGQAVAIAHLAPSDR